MAKRFLLKILIVILSTPFVVVSRAAEIFNLWKIRNDIDKCIAVVDSYKDEIPDDMISVLIAAEDKRSSFHLGIDPLAFFRAAYMTVIGYRQGASTIEQQFVRVTIERYEPSLRRKLREQILALAVARHRPKREIAAAYLSTAFYGSGLIGLQALKSRCGQTLLAPNAADVIGMVARLKYPEPLVPSDDWLRKVSTRTKYLATLLKRHGLDTGKTGMLYCFPDM